MKKGFTLIELLGIVIVIGLIVAFVVPSIMRTNKTSDNLEYENFLNTLSMATETYYQSNKGICDFSTNDVCYVQVGELISAKLIEVTLINPKTKTQIASTDVVIISRDDSGVLTYEYSTEES